MIINYPFIKNEIHIIIGGDHGAGSFKMSLQVANVENPNRKDNTVVFVSISSLLLNALKLKLRSFKNLQFSDIEAAT